MVSNNSTIMGIQKLVTSLNFLFKFFFSCRYFDNININGTLDITNIQTMMQNWKLINNYRPQGLQVLSLKNNNITNVIYNKSLLTEGHTIF
jgi:hypothetical protein